MKLILALFVFLISIATIPLDKISSKNYTDDMLIIDGLMDDIGVSLDSINDLFTKRFQEILGRIVACDLNTVTEKEYNKLKKNYENLKLDVSESSVNQFLIIRDKLHIPLPDYKDRKSLDERDTEKEEQILFMVDMRKFLDKLPKIDMKTITKKEYNKLRKEFDILARQLDMPHDPMPDYEDRF